MVNTQILDSLYNMIGQAIAFIPTLVVVIVLAIIGLIAGKIIGKIGATILDKIGLDNLLDTTVIGGMVKKADMTTVGMFESAIKIFIYLIFAVIIIDMLQLQLVANFIAQLIAYIPLIVSAVVLLIIGLLIVDFISDLIRTFLMATGIDDAIMKGAVGDSLKASGMSPSGIISGLVKLYGYLIFISAAVEILQFTMLTEFLVGVVAYLPSLFMGILLLIIGLLVIDFFADNIQAAMKGANVEGMDVILPLLKGFLFFIVILMALETMLIKVNIFYVFLGPLAWGVAIVVAFKWGIKDALVAYAQAKK